MQKAQFPERQCREHVPYSVGSGEDAIPMVALCEMAEHEDDGPHVNFGVPVSVKHREQWEARNAHED